MFCKLFQPVKGAATFLAAVLGVFFWASQTAWAQAPAGAEKAPGFGELLSRMLPMFAIVFLIFYFLVMRPQQDKLKAQRQLLNSLKRGDQVITSSGVFGKIAGVEKDFILLEVANNVKIKLELSHISKKIEKESAEKTAA